MGRAVGACAHCADTETLLRHIKTVLHPCDGARAAGSHGNTGALGRYQDPAGCSPASWLHRALSQLPRCRQDIAPGPTALVARRYGWLPQGQRRVGFAAALVRSGLAWLWDEDRAPGQLQSAVWRLAAAACEGAAAGHAAAPVCALGDVGLRLAPLHHRFAARTRTGGQRWSRQAPDETGATAWANAQGVEGTGMFQGPERQWSRRVAGGPFLPWQNLAQLERPAQLPAGAHQCSCPGPHAKRCGRCCSPATLDARRGQPTMRTRRWFTSGQGVAARARRGAPSRCQPVRTWCPLLVFRTLSFQSKKSVAVFVLARARLNVLRLDSAKYA